MTRVAFQGEHGAYSELAIGLLWPGSECVPCHSTFDVIRVIARGEVGAGVLPVENSIAGTVTDTLDALLESDGVCITGETVVQINHCLLGIPGTSMSEIRRVESHPVALAQCGAFFERHPEIEARAAYDTAGAARAIALAGDRSRAAIAGAAAAERYELSVLQKGLEDNPDNRTRFIGMARAPYKAAGGSSCKTTLAIRMEDPSQLQYRVIDAMAAAGMRITRLDGSAPRGPAPRGFVLEVSHRGDGSELAGLLERLKIDPSSFRILGTFPVSPQGWR